MKDRCLVFLITLCICFIALSATKADSTLSPAGVGMCERLCQRTVGCTRFQYSTRYLSCHLPPGPGGYKGPDASYLSFNVTLDKLFGQEKTAPCPLLSLIFKTVQNRQICRKKSPMLPQPSEKRPMTRLLFSDNYKRDINQLFLQNNTVATYIQKNMDVKTMRYIEHSRSLLFTEYHSQRLTLCTLNGKDTKIVTFDCNAFCVTEDKTYFVSYQRKLTSVSHFGTKKAIIKQIRINAHQMAADINNRRLFLMTHTYNIAIYDYFGQKQRELKVRTKDIYIEPYSNWLYYMKAHLGIYKMALLDKKPSAFPVHNSSGQSFCIYNDIVYEGVGSSIKIVSGENTVIDVDYPPTTCCFVP